MPIHIIIEIIAIAGVSILGLLLTLANQKLLTEVNAQSPQDLQQPSPHDLDVLRLVHIHREYRRLFPEGNLHIRIRVMAALMLACLLVGAVAVRIF